MSMTPRKFAAAASSAKLIVPARITRLILPCHSCTLNATVYPPPPVRARFEMERVYTSDELRVFNRAWQRFKTGQ